ncbi:MAG: hypothetical protein R2712_25270 [Vicinamibacterales bacterium]
MTAPHFYRAKARRQLATSVLGDLAHPVQVTAAPRGTDFGRQRVLKTVSADHSRLEGGQASVELYLLRVPIDQLAKRFKCPLHRDEVATLLRGVQLAHLTTVFAETGRNVAPQRPKFRIELVHRLP